ncbi:MAG: TonB family protein [Bermanella sp.]
MLIKHLLCILLFTSIVQVSFSLELNGIGSYTQLRKEFYIGALYLTEKSDDPNIILASGTSKRMALRVTTKRWSPRRWSLQWQNDIAINNTAQGGSELTNHLLTFTGFLDDNLIKGDEITVDYISTVGTIIKINNVKIIETNTAELFNFLVNVWIGKLPPSGEFKDGILGKNSAESKALLSSYNALSYDASRTQMVSSWITARENAILAKQREKALIKQAKLERAQKAREKAKNEAEAAALQLAQQQAEKARAKTYKPPKKIVKKKVITKKKKIASESPKKSTSKSNTEITAENKYYLELYRWELIREIRNAVEYPTWAKKFGQKGDVTLNFLVNRQAEVSNIKGNNSDVSDLLVAEITRAILAVTPFILPPDALPGNSWSISITYIFDPKSDKQPYIKKPRRPDSLSNSKALSRAQYKAMLSKYIDDIKAMINDQIEYPVWAKNLNQKGKVEIDVVITEDGEISEIIDKDISRHETLNKEVRDAIRDSEPFPAIPSRLNIDSTTITIKHEFK